MSAGLKVDMSNNVGAAVRLAVLPLSYLAMRGQHAQAWLALQIQELRQR
jgi:hypothetical protein